MTEDRAGIGRRTWAAVKPHLLHGAYFLGMLVLAMAAIAYTNADPARSFILWQLLAPVFAIICIGTQWRRTAATAADRGRLVGVQVLHWGVLWLSMQVLRLPLFSVVMTADALGIAALLLLALSTMMAGIYLDWRFGIVGASMLGGLIVIGYLEQTGMALVLLALAGVALVVAGGWLRSRRRARSAPE